MPSRRSGFVPPQPLSIDGFYRHFDVEENLTFIAMALQRHFGTRIDDLPDYQSWLFRDLLNPIDEDAMAEMFAYWRLDLRKLHARGQQHLNPVQPAKARIEVEVEITSKGNLKAEWYPTGWGRWGCTSDDTDFLWFHRAENRNGSFGSRPSNELFFLRGVQDAIYDLGDRDLRYGALSHPLLAASANVVERVKERLERHFEVTMLTDVFIEWRDEKEKDDHSWRSKYRIASFEIDDPKIRQSKAENAELEQMAERLGFSEEALTAACRLFEADAASPAKLSEELKKQGLPATPKKVERALYLIDRHRPKQLRPRNLDNVTTLTTRDKR